MIIEGYIFLYFCLKSYVVTSHLNCLVEKFQMKGHNIGFCAELTKIIPTYHQIFPLIYSSGNSATISECDLAILWKEKDEDSAHPGTQPPSSQLTQWMND